VKAFVQLMMSHNLKSENKMYNEKLIILYKLNTINFEEKDIINILNEESVSFKILQFF